MSNADQTYADALRFVIYNGIKREDRTGVGTTSYFGYSMNFDLRSEFPILEGKKIHWPSVAHELLWMISGSTNANDLSEKDVTIWEEWRRPVSNRDLVLVERRDAVPSCPPTEISTDLTTYADTIDKKLVDIWRRMMKRCYVPTSDKYRAYGAKGVTVHPRWHSAAAFVEDAKRLPHWSYKLASWDDFELDKDYYGSQQYGPETCVWIPHDENVSYTNSATPVRVVDIDGQEHIYITQAEASRRLGLSATTLNRMVGTDAPISGLKSSNVRFNSWVFEKASFGDYLLRQELIEDGDLGPVYGKNWRSWSGYDNNRGEYGIDQLAEAIRLIKEDPTSRRIIVNAWNVADLDEMALPPCHMFYQFYVDGDYLDVQVYQRSADIFLGVPFNISSYALLLSLVAHVTGKTPRFLRMVFGDLHLYNNHQEAAAKYLDQVEKVDIYSRPMLVIATTHDDIDQITYEDFALSDYYPQPAIKAPVAV